MKDNRVPLQAHLSMFAAEAIWGLMTPVGKAAMNSGFDGISVVSFRVVGADLPDLGILRIDLQPVRAVFAGNA